MHWATRPVDRQLVKIGSAEARQLRVQIGEQASLQQRVVAEVDAGNDMSGMEGDLLGFSKEVVRITIQNHLADGLQGDEFFRNQLGRVENVERQGVGLFLIERLHRQLPFRVIAAFDCIVQVTAMKVGVCAADLHRLVPQHRCGTEFGTPVEFDEGGLPFTVDEPEGMDTEAFHHAQRTRNGAVRHGPQDHVHTFGHQRNEVPEGIVRRRGLRIAAVGFHLGGVDEVGKFHRVLNEKHRDIVSD